MQLENDHTIVLLTGGPGTGKSYAARQILSQIPALVPISYDEIKEEVWDRFGFDNAAQKDRVNWFSLEQFYLTLQRTMWEGKPILAEYPFYQRHKEKLRELIEQSGYRAVTVLLYGDWKVIYDRGQSRDQESDRHPGHLTYRYHPGRPVLPEDLIPQQDLTYEQFRRQIDQKNYDIQLGTTIRVDVTDFSRVDYKETAAQIIRAASSNNK